MKAIASFCIVLVLMLSGCNNQLVTLEVANPSDFDRTEELVEIPLVDLEKKLSLGEQQTYEITDETGAVLLSQLTYDNKLLFQPRLKANQLKKFQVAISDKKEDSVSVKVYGRYFPERKDDYAWENECLGFRFYGEALKQVQDPTNGLDIWLKRTRRMVLEDWYKNDIAHIASYHVDHGEGCDPYGVGPTLGAGAMAPWVEGQLIRNENYSSYVELDKGPLRITFELSYPKLDIKGQTIEDRRLISLDAGSYYTRIEQKYSLDQLDVAAGIVKRNGQDSILVDANKYYLIYQEPVMEPNGQVYVGLIFPDKFDTHKVDTYEIGKKKFQHTLAIKKEATPSVIYYTGFGWSKDKFPTVSFFEAYSKNYIEALLNPFKITLK